MQSPTAPACFQGADWVLNDQSRPVAEGLLPVDPCFVAMGMVPTPYATWHHVEEDEMHLISTIEVEGFRSIRKGKVDDLGDFTALAGLSNSGKSNLLRALNAFFSGQSEPGRPLNLATDYHRPSLAKKQARKIRITVEFTLPSTFSFRQDLKPVETLLSGTTFTITREWTRRQPLGIFFLNGRALTLDEQQKLEQFLQLINFRYIPNRVCQST